LMVSVKKWVTVHALVSNGCIESEISRSSLAPGFRGNGTRTGSS
jgi:hypothetical protein